jgi:hypothetical protein
MDIGGAQDLISIGFSIYVAVWMLNKSSKDSEALKDTVNELKNAVTSLTVLIQERGDKKNDV